MSKCCNGWPSGRPAPIRLSLRPEPVWMVLPQAVEIIQRMGSAAEAGRFRSGTTSNEKEDV